MAPTTMGMAGRYIKRFAVAKKLLLVNKSSSSSAPFSPGRPHNHLIRLLGTTTGTNTRVFPGYGLSVEFHLGRTMSTLGSPAPAPAECSGSSDSIYFSIDDIGSQVRGDEYLMKEELPVMYTTLRYSKWSSLQSYCGTKDKFVDIKVALENELVALSVWLLFIDVPARVKEGVAWALKDICSRTSQAAAAATDMHNDEESVTRYASTKISSFDQESVDALVLDVLSSNNEEVLRQVCCSLVFVAESRRRDQTVDFGSAIQHKLFQLYRECESPALAHILYAINGICAINRRMREKIIEVEFSDGILRRSLMRAGRLDNSLKAQAYQMVLTILVGHCNDKLWKYVKEHLMPPILNGCFIGDINVKTAGARVVSMFMAIASSHCIKEMVDLGCLKTLIHLLDYDDTALKDKCLRAVDNILSSGDPDPSKNEYAKMIDDITKERDQIDCDWEVFFVNHILTDRLLTKRASGIVMRNRPDKYPEWLEWQERLSGRPY